MYHTVWFIRMYHNSAAGLELPERSSAESGQFFEAISNQQILQACHADNLKKASNAFQTVQMWQESCLKYLLDTIWI